ncbi:MAG: hypothetical protein ACLP7Q_07390 [Isosphaeraceae bacterium]
MTIGLIRTAADIDLETEARTQRQLTQPDEQRAASLFRPQGETTKCPLQALTHFIIWLLTIAPVSCHGCFEEGAFRTDGLGEKREVSYGQAPPPFLEQRDNFVASRTASITGVGPDYLPCINYTR